MSRLSLNSSVHNERVMPSIASDSPCAKSYSGYRHHSVAATVVRRVPDAQQQRVAHDHVRVREIDLCAQHVRAVRKLTRAHATQHVEILFNRAIRDTRLGVFPVS